MNPLLVRRLAPTVYGLIAVILLLVNTTAFIVWLIVGAVLVGLLYASLGGRGGRERHRRR